MMVDYAHKQLEYAVQKWKDIEEINQRYFLQNKYCFKISYPDDPNKAHK